MKFTIALLSLITCSTAYGQASLNLTEEQKLRALQYTVACVKQEKIATDAAAALMRGQLAGAKKNLQCFANCFLERAGFLIDGVIQPSIVLAKLGPNVGEAKVNDIMTQCNSLKGSDHCETAFVLYECYYKQHTAIF